MNVRKRTGNNRLPLTNEELESLTVQEFLRIKLTDDEKRRYREINRAREEDRQQSIERIRTEALPILNELRDAGIEVESLGDLIGRSTPYASAIPILLKHLQLSYSDAVRSTIARCLAVPEPKVIADWEMIEELYLAAKEGKGFVALGDTSLFQLGFKDALACTLAAAATEGSIEALLQLLRDKNNGPSRILLLRALKRVLSREKLEIVFGELSSDSDLYLEIKSLRSRKN